MEATQLVARRPLIVWERMGKWPDVKWFTDKEAGSAGFVHLEELLPWRVLWFSVRSNQHTPPAPPSRPVGGLCNHWIFCGRPPPPTPPITHRHLPLSLARSLALFFSDPLVSSDKSRQLFRPSGGKREIYTNVFIYSHSCCSEKPQSAAAQLPSRSSNRHEWATWFRGRRVSETFLLQHSRRTM